MQRQDTAPDRTINIQGEYAPLAQATAAEQPLGRVGFLWLALPVIAVILAVRLVELDWLPGEFYGDIAIVYEYVRAILQGHWPTYYVLSAGPAYHYLIAPVVWLTGLNYLGIKLASVLVSLGGLAAIFALARELVDREFALLAALIAGISSWLLIFSRLGNSQILLPLLSGGAAYFAVQVARRGRYRDVFLCALFSAIGLYTLPQTFILPPVMFLTLLALSWTRVGVRRRHLAAFVLATIPLAIPFALIVAQNPANFFNGYIGGKLGSDVDVLSVLPGNILRALLALHVKGDVTFRSNPKLLPHLDPLSGLLFLIGGIFWLRQGWRRWSPVLFVPLLLLQVPSIMVLRFPVEVPSASRTLAITPMVYILVASGLWWIFTWLRGSVWRSALLLVAIVLTLVTLNLDRYFNIYPDGLPNHNTPFGVIIAGYIDRLPPEAHAYMIGEAWGDWSQPDRKSIEYVLTGPQSLEFVKPEEVDCQWLVDRPHPSALIWSPFDQKFERFLEGCLGPVEPELYDSQNGGLVFQALVLP